MHELSHYYDLLMEIILFQLRACLLQIDNIVNKKDRNFIQTHIHTLVFLMATLIGILPGDGVYNAASTTPY